jgi:hypothetical protein
MENQVQNKQSSNINAQGFFANPQVYLNTERGTLTHRLGADMRIVMPINLYKKILDLPFEKKPEADRVEETATRRNTLGLIARPAVYLSKDGNYLIHQVLGMRVSKHVNYYKKILSDAAQASTEAKSA